MQRERRRRKANKAHGNSIKLLDTTLIHDISLHFIHPYVKNIHKRVFFRNKSKQSTPYASCDIYVLRPTCKARLPLPLHGPFAFFFSCASFSRVRTWHVRKLRSPIIRQVAWVVKKPLFLRTQKAGRNFELSLSHEITRRDFRCSNSTKQRKVRATPFHFTYAVI